MEPEPEPEPAEPEPEPEPAEPEPEPAEPPEPVEPVPTLHSSSDSDDSDDFESVQGDEQLMQDVEDDDATSIPTPQGSEGRIPQSALSPLAVDEGMAAQMAAGAGQSQLDLEYRRRFLSLRPLFRGIFNYLSTPSAKANEDGGMEPSTLEGLAKTLFPQSALYEPPNSSADTQLVSWAEFCAFAETAEHIPRDEAEWEQLMENLNMLHASTSADGPQVEATSTGQPNLVSLASAEAAATASWTGEPGLREEHVPTLACPSPHGRAPVGTHVSGVSTPRIGAGIRSQSRSDLSVDEIVGGSTRPAAHEPDLPDEADSAPGDSRMTGRQRHIVGRVESQVRKKDTRDLDRLVYCQRLAAHHGAVWAMRFSQDGRWLATGGQDTIVRIWRAQMWNESDSRSVSARVVVESEPQNDVDVSRETCCTSPVPGDGQLDDNALAARRAFDPDPEKELRGHQQDVLDLAWSRDNFLLSASADATVNLWHTSTSVCLRTYQHNDFVTSVMFNPADDTCFISGSLSGQLSLWHIPSHSVVAHREIDGSITAAALNPDGQMVVAGTFEGKANFFRLEVQGSGSEVTGATLGHLAQLDLSVKEKKSRGLRNRGKGKKITSIAFRPGLSTANDTALGFNSDEVLISSNDDRVRLFTIRWPQQHGAAPVEVTRSVKFSGHCNSESQLRASFSWDGQFISCASDDRNIYFWRAETEAMSKHPDHQKRWERFRGAESALTASLMAPPSLKVPPVFAAPTTDVTMTGRGAGAGSNSTGEQPERPGMVLLTASYSGAIKIWAF